MIIYSTYSINKIMSFLERSTYIYKGEVEEDLNNQIIDISLSFIDGKRFEMMFNFFKSSL